MEEILRMARELGRAIAAHRFYRTLREAEAAVAVDEEAKRLAEEFNRQQEKILRLSEERKPIEPEDKRRLADLQQQVAGNELLKRLQAAQVDFRHLMDGVDEAIREALNPPD